MTSETIQRGSAGLMLPIADRPEMGNRESAPVASHRDDSGNSNIAPSSPIRKQVFLQFR